MLSFTQPSTSGSPPASTDPLHHNLVERWFSELTTKLLKRGQHRSVRALNNDIRNWIEDWDETPRPYVWTKTADQILDSIKRYCERTNGQDTSCRPSDGCPGARRGPRSANRS